MGSLAGGLRAEGVRYISLETPGIQRARLGHDTRLYYRWQSANVFELGRDAGETPGFTAVSDSG